MAIKNRVASQWLNYTNYWKKLRIPLGLLQRISVAISPKKWARVWKGSLKKKNIFFSVLSEVQNNRKRIFKSRGEKKKGVRRWKMTVLQMTRVRRQMLRMVSENFSYWAHTSDWLQALQWSWGRVLEMTNPSPSSVRRSSAPNWRSDDWSMSYGWIKRVRLLWAELSLPHLQILLLKS